MDVIVSIIIIILTAILCLPLVKSYIKKKAISKCIDQLPGDKAYPVIGTGLKILTSKREMYWHAIKDRHSKYGPIFRSWIGSIPIVHIFKPEHAQIILKSNTNINKGRFYKVFVPLLGGGLISGNLPKWRHHRKLITPAFHFKVMGAYADTFAEKGEEFGKFLDQFSGKGHIEIMQYLTRLSMDVILETAMGIQLNFLRTSQSEYAESISGVLKGAFSRMYNLVLQNDFLFGLTENGKDSQRGLDYICNFNKKVIEQRKEYLSKNKHDTEQEDEFGRKIKMSFLDILLTHQANNNFKDEEIEEEINTFMFAGQDTSAATVGFTLMALGNNPDIMKKVQDELDIIFEGDPDRKITTSDVANMNYLDMVVKEVLRCYNFVPYLGRELVEDVVIDGVHIPKGVNVIISLYDLHHDENHYPDPWKFDPDRFLPEHVEKRHPFAFVPFSAGPRNCIGQKFGMQNVKTILAYIMRRYNVTCQERPEDINYYLEIVLKPQNGLHVAFEPRQKQ